MAADKAGLEQYRCLSSLQHINIKTNIHKKVQNVENVNFDGGCWLLVRWHIKNNQEK